MQTRLSDNQSARINGYINSLRYSEKVARLGLGHKLQTGRLNSYLPFTKQSENIKTLRIYREGSSGHD